MSLPNQGHAIAAGQFGLLQLEVITCAGYLEHQMQGCKYRSEGNARLPAACVLAFDLRSHRVRNRGKPVGEVRSERDRRKTASLHFPLSP